MDTIAFHQVKKSLGDFKLDIQSLDIKKGYITGFIGENGAGKTTTIKLILDMLIADEGKIQIFGMDTRKNSDSIKEEIGYVGETAGYPEESKIKVIKNMIAPFYKNWDENLFTKYMQNFRINIDKKYGEFSAGQKKQFAIAMALAHRPKLILLDEPTTNLDPVVRNEILEMLMEHMQNEEVTVFYSTHITSDLEKAADYIVYIKQGEILINQEREELLRNYSVVKGPKNLLDKEIKKYLLGYRQTSLGFEALLSDKKVAEQIFGTEVRYVTPTIEDIMLFLGQKGEGMQYETYR
ncbi:MAG: transporter ATP-binding protein [Clostridia bacterium]|jgi:ABC-2 type transport system ATP-binding protein|nr:transporter ATP-binding protein [Clostridia bacterium]